MAKHSREEWRGPRQPRPENVEALPLLRSHALASTAPSGLMRSDREARRRSLPDLTPIKREAKARGVLSSQFLADTTTNYLNKTRIVSEPPRKGTFVETGGNLLPDPIDCPSRVQ